MNKNKFEKLKSMLNFLKQHIKTISVEIDKENRIFTFEVKNENDFIALVAFMGWIGGFYDVQYSFENKHKIYYIDLIDFDENWESHSQIY